MKLPTTVNILLIGNGARECALACKIAQSGQLGQLFIAPGNGGTLAYGTNVDIDPLDFSVVGQFVLQNHINLVVVGPEEPLVRGIKDFFVENPQIRHIPVLGPSKLAAQLEGSKDFAKVFMNKYHIPTAAYLTVNKDNIEQGEAFLDTMTAPYVLKADGLAAGKGVLILDNLLKAKDELRQMIENQKFGAASASVVVEQFLSGIELSVFVATDSKNYIILPSAKDYKRVGDGDTGLNTGGMGAVSPVCFADEAFMAKVEQRIVKPTIKGIAAEKLDYHGFVFIGIINCAGEPYVIEYNVRLGDPETEVVMPRITSDIIDLFDGIVHNTLSEKKLVVTPQTAVTVVCTSGGYPESYKKGFPISGLPTVPSDVTTVFHSGTVASKGDILTNGGRVLAVTSLGANIAQALTSTYQTIGHITYEGIYFRKDIGQDLINLEK